VAPPAETDELRTLLERYPALSGSERARLRRLYKEARATDVMALMSDARFADKLRRIDPPLDIAWDRALAWSSFAAAVLMILWLMFLTPQLL
jgi:hypothetical protein